MTQEYNEDYFLRGQELGISGYTNYRYLPDMTLPMVASMVSHLKIDPADTILDFGCARGYVVRAFREMGYVAKGYDLSTWAIDNCDPEVKGHVFHVDADSNIDPNDWVIAKDVLEHIENAADVVTALMDAARKGVFAVVPLAGYDGGHYVVEEYEKDVTHFHRLSLASWVRMFLRPGWCVDARYRVRGVKDNYANWPDGNGFIVARRIGG